MTTARPAPAPVPRRRAVALAAALSLALALPHARAAQAAAPAGPTGTFRVDDSASSVAEPLAQMRWRQFVPGRGADHTVEASTTVFVRLNLAPWLRRHGRLYLALAPTTGEPVRATWQTQGRLLPGSLQSGNRALVYEGPIEQAVLQETLALALQTDGRKLTDIQTLQFHFEIDVLR